MSASVTDHSLQEIQQEDVNLIAYELSAKRLQTHYNVSQSSILKSNPLLKLSKKCVEYDVFKKKCKQRRYMIMQQSDLDDRLKRWIELTDIYTGPESPAPQRKSED